MIRVDAAWLAVDALDMRSGTESALARVVNVFGSARPHHAYLFANRRANRMKVLVHDGVGIWLAARRLHSGKFAWPKDVTGTLTLTREQLDALVLGLPKHGQSDVLPPAVLKKSAARRASNDTPFGRHTFGGRVAPNDSSTRFRTLARSLMVSPLFILGIVQCR